MRVAVVGAGHVGLVMAGCLADLEHDVVCADVDLGLVSTLSAGGATVHEVGLAELLARNLGGRLRFTGSIAEAVEASDVSMITVGTPAADDGIDLTQVLAAATAVGSALRTQPAGHVVVVKSTVVPGSTDGPIRAAIEGASGLVGGADFGLSANPEFLTEGRAVPDVLHPDRIVIGGVDERTRDTVAALYAACGDVPLIRTTNTTAELIKYASNALLATAISFANEIADVCSALADVDVVDVMAGLHASRYLTRRHGDQLVRAGLTSFLAAGCGFGGGCLPKDLRSLVFRAGELGVEMKVASAVLAVNDGRANRVVEGIAGDVDLDGARVTVLGLAFKEDTDDVRESPAFPVIARLLQNGAKVTVYDPVANEPARRALGEAAVRFADEFEGSVAEADVIVIVTRWHEFETLPTVLARLGRPPLVFDGRRLLEPDSVERYAGIGR